MRRSRFNLVRIVGDDLYERIEALERVVLRLHRDDHAVRRNEALIVSRPSVGGQSTRMKS